jgi:hypothetical protein
MAQNDAQAAQWFARAAAQGVVEAQYQLGMSYLRGTGVPKDNARAAALLKESASLRNSDGLYNLALLYEEGNGVSRDKKRAFDYFYQAAELGNADAQLRVGMDYARGQNVKQDDSMADVWLREAAQRGSVEAEYELALRSAQDHAEAYFWSSLAYHNLDGEKQVKATALHDASLKKLKSPERAEVDARLVQWREAHPEQP